MSTRPSAWSKIGAACRRVGLGALLLGSGCSPSDTSVTGCHEAADCVMEGTDCDPQEHVCNYVCKQEACHAGSECSARFGQCTPVECGQVVVCANPGNICDLTVHACYPSNGKCSSNGDCPLFDHRVSRSASLSCQDGFCRLTSPVPAIPLDGFPPRAAAAIRVFSPTPGTHPDTAEDLLFQWDSDRTNTAIALVLTYLPADLSQVLPVAIWGRMLPVGAAPILHWSEGVAIQNGKWLASSAAVPSVPLYFVVQEVRSGQLLALSPPIPFRIGSSWPALYDPCSDNNVLPGSCHNPERPQICWEGFCRLMCASHADCAPTLCGPPVGGVRICG